MINELKHTETVEDGATRFETKTYSFNTTVGAKPGDSFSVTQMDFNGNPINHINASEIDERLARRYGGLFHIQEDLREAINALDASSKLSTDIPVIVRSSLLVNAVTSYGRCFTQADGRDGVKLEDSSPWILNIGNEKKWHEELMQLRHQIFAHAGTHHFSQIGTTIAVDSLEKPTMIALSVLRWSLEDLGQESLIDMKEHIQKVLARVIQKLNEVGRKLEDLARKDLIKPNRHS
jgi:hypothetical protein